MKKTRAVLVAALVGCASAAVLAVPGLRDTSFNGTGFATTDFAIAGIGTWHSATAVAVDSQRRPVAVGLTTPGPDITIYDVAIARYNADGTPDTSFNGSGKVIYDVGGDDRAAVVAIDSQDRILVAGSSDWKEGCDSYTCGGDFDFFLLRFNVDGSLDTTYADGGRLIVDSGSPSDSALTVPAWGSITTVFTVTLADTVLPGSYQLPVFDQRLTDPAHTALVTVDVAASPMALTQTVAHMVDSGAIDSAGIATSLTQEIAAGAYAAAKQHVQAQTGKHITAAAAVILIANLDDLIRQG